MKCQRTIYWNDVPEIITKDLFCQICHISKSTAGNLLKSGAVPCEYTGKKTRCYRIKKDDVQKYLENRGKFPEYYSALNGWYAGNDTVMPPMELTEDTLQRLSDYYAGLLSDYNDVVSTQDVVNLTGYVKTTVNNWCGKGRIKCFVKRNANYIPKVFLIEFFCSPYFRSIARKTFWHKQTVNEFYCIMQKGKK